MRISSSNITSLREGEVFVFGSNLAGIHGAGAARTARRWGAKMYNGKGLQGQTYAIPTKDSNIRTLDYHIVESYVNEFIEFAKLHPELNFLVTEVGCGLAGFKVSEMAFLFREALNIKNIYLPIRFINDSIVPEGEG